MLKYSTINQNKKKYSLSKTATTMIKLTSLNLPYVLELFDKCIHTFVYILDMKKDVNEKIYIYKKAT